MDICLPDNKIATVDAPSQINRIFIKYWMIMIHLN